MDHNNPTDREAPVPSKPTSSELVGQLRDQIPTDISAQLNKRSQPELNAFVNAYMAEHGRPKEVYDGEKNTLFGWTDDGKGVWVLPMSKANFDRFGDVAKSHPGLGQCELMRLTGVAQFFADWRDSDRARAAKSQGPEPSRAGNCSVSS